MIYKSLSPPNASRIRAKEGGLFEEEYEGRKGSVRETKACGRNNEVVSGRMKGEEEMDTKTDDAPLPGEEEKGKR